MISRKLFPLLSNELPIEKATTAESELLVRRLFLRSIGKWSSAAIVAAVGGGVWISSAPEARAGGWINRRGLFEAGAGSIAGSKLFGIGSGINFKGRGRNAQAKAQTAEAEAGLLARILSLATSVTLASELDAICQPWSLPCYPLKIANNHKFTDLVADAGGEERGSRGGCQDEHERSCDPLSGDRGK